MEYIEGVEGLESDYCLDEHTPNLTFLEEFFLLLVVDDLLVEVTVVGKLHDNAAYHTLYHRFLPSKKASLYPTIWPFFMLAKMRTSLRAFSIYF